MFGQPDLCELSAMGHLGEFWLREDASLNLVFFLLLLFHQVHLPKQLVQLLILPADRDLVLLLVEPALDGDFLRETLDFPLHFLL